MKKLLLFIILEVYANAALLFTLGNNDYVDIGKSSTINNIKANAATIAIWLRPLDTTTNYRFLGTLNTSVNYTFNPGTTLVQMQIPRATTNLLVRATIGGTTLPSYIANTWVFIATTYDVAGTNGQQQLWNGNLTTPVVEATAYTNQLVGTGAVTDTSMLDLFIGGVGNNTLNFNGRIAWVGIWNRRLSLGELKSQQYAPHVTSGCVEFIWLNGVGTQADWSGSGNNGVVTGTSVVNGVPIRPFSAWIHKFFPTMPAWIH